MNNCDKDEILNAINKIINAFSQHDKDVYFSTFSEDATFLFHNHNQLLENRSEYEAEWSKWEKEHNFQVIECISTAQHLQIIGNVAIFTHNVETTVNYDSQKEKSNERETIVLAQDKLGKWLGVHEHLSLISC